MNILDALRRMTGMTLARSSVEQAVKRRMERTGAPTRKLYAESVDEAELRALVDLVVVPESWLFRDPQAFAVAAGFTRERLAGGARLVRILSVPCAGGEEPYSMAMALADAGVAPESFMIDAVDISAACIARAEAGIFGRNAFRGQDLAFRERYFAAAGADEYRIGDALRSRVRFSQGSVLQGALGSASRYDVIFCRNLLIYFDEATTNAAIDRLGEHLADDGILLAGYAEVPSFARRGFGRLPHRQAFALRKEKPPAGVPAMAALPTPALPRPAPARPLPPAAARAPVRPPPLSEPARAPSAPAATQSLLSHARAMADAGKAGEAEAACREWLAQQPESAEAYFILGLLAEGASQAAAAESHLRRCLYLQPDHYEALCHLALLQEQGGNRSAAATLKARAARVYQRQQAQ